MKKSLLDIANQMHRADPTARFAFKFWDGEDVVYGDRPEVILQFKSREGAKQLLRKGFFGLGEGYMAGDLEVEGNLQELLRLGLSIEFDQHSLSFWQKMRFLLHQRGTRNTSGRVLKNISRHYDRGDDFYALFLDKTMTYSCGYFNSDIGCGWGGMLIYAAQKYGIKGLGNTLSRNQCECAKRKIQELGLQNQIEVVLKDYREITGKFDKFVSIGMFEHVGKAFIPVFMHKVSQLLKKGGIGLLHTIGKNTESPSDPWIMKYIFPGYYIPNLAEIVREMGRSGFLHACSAGFKYGSSRLYQILFSNGLNNGLPLTRKHLYQDESH
jgi:cyclopropane-fatty-acyl-phospholipid synthase